MEFDKAMDLITQICDDNGIEMKVKWALRDVLVKHSSKSFADGIDEGKRIFKPKKTDLEARLDALARESATVIKQLQDEG